MRSLREIQMSRRHRHRHFLCTCIGCSYDEKLHTAYRLKFIELLDMNELIRASSMAMHISEEMGPCEKKKWTGLTITAGDCVD